MSKLDEADRDYTVKWALSSAGQRCVLHVVAIKQFMDDMPASNIQPLHVPRTLLFAAVCLLCFVKYGSFDVEQLEISCSQEPPLQHLGQIRVSPGLLLADLDLCAETGRPAPTKVNAVLHGLIDILDRNGYWMVCHIFAAGLREAIEREPEQVMPQKFLRTAPQLLRANHNTKQAKLGKHLISPIGGVDAMDVEADAVASHDGDRQDVDLLACRRCWQQKRPYSCTFKLGRQRCDGCVRDKKSCDMGLVGIHNTSRPMKRQAIPEDDTTTDQEKRHLPRSKRVKRIIDSESDVLRDQESRDQLHNDSFNERFASCTWCFGASVNCRKPSPGKVCERCLEYGLPCIERDRPYMRAATVASQMESQHAQGASSCRRCSQIGQRCHKKPWRRLTWRQVL